ncbi:MAG TPA: hypothetical protein DCY56_06870 [Candidatus Omnitrophica bacterium]|nr:hypothetical protein [Candidatus Omnitrophota bacterium]
MNRVDEEKDLTTRLKEDEKKKKIIEEVHNLIKEWETLELPVQAEKRDLIIRSIPLLAEQDRVLCIKRLSEVGIVNQKDALKTVKRYAMEMGIDKDETPVINYAPHLSIITPAQDFIDDTAYVTIPVNICVDNKVKSINYIITSEKQKIRLSDEELLKMNLYSERSPCLNKRWSDKSIELFTNGKENIKISDVFTDIYKLSKSYIDLGNDTWTKYKTLWIIATYFQRIFDTFPYVHLNGDMESGKTKTLMFTAWLSFNGELTFNSSPAYIIRAVHNNHSTCCVDEIERLRRSDDQDSQALIAMYNAGYKKGSFCGKCEQVNEYSQWLPKQFEAYSPKMFASIKGFESSLSSRCIPIIMLKTGNKEIKNRELNNNDKSFQDIRDKLYHIMLTYSLQVKVFYQTIKDEEILGREWELSKPILTIAKVIDNDSDSKFNLYDEIRNHALEIQKLKKEARREDTITPKVLMVLKEVFSEREYPKMDDFWTINELLEIFKGSGEEDFAWLNDEKKQNKGRWLGKALRYAGLVKGRAEQRKIDGKNIKGFRIHLEEIEKRLENCD